MNPKRLVLLLAASGLASSRPGRRPARRLPRRPGERPGLPGARAPQYQASVERLPQARAGYLPFVTGSAGATGTTTSATARRTSTTPRADFNVTLSQPIFRMQNWIAISPGGEAGAAGRGDAHHGQPGPDRARGAGLLRRAARAGQRRPLRRPEARHLRAARAGQAQLRGRHRDDRRHARGAGALRPGGRARRSSTRTTSR